MIKSKLFLFFKEKALLIPSHVNASLILYFRQFASQFLGLITGVVLARNLSAAEFGIYSVLTFQFYLHLSIGDLGLGGSAVRQVTVPASDTLKLIQGVRHILDIAQIVIVWILADFLADIYGLGQQTAQAFLFVSFAAGIQSFQIVPTILMERSLQFERLTIIELSQAMIFTILCIYSIYFSSPVTGIAYAWLAYAATGALMAYAMQPWNYGIKIRFAELRERLSFAMPYQTIQLATLLRDSFTPVAIGFFLGAAAVGYMSWATTLALSIPVGSLVLQRLFLPVMSRYQDDRDALRQYLEESITLTHNAVVPISVIILVLSRSITAVVFGEKWLAALPLFNILWASCLSLPFHAPLFSFFNALAKPGTVLFFMLKISAATWIIGMPLLYLFGIEGYAIAGLTVQTLTISLIIRAKRLVNFNILQNIIPVWILSLIMGVIIYLLSLISGSENILSIILLSITGLLFYALAYVIFKSRFLKSKSAQAKIFYGNKI